MNVTKIKLDFVLNGKKQVLNVNPSDRISKVLREDLGLMGTKVGCNAGDCGSCTILVNKEPICSCLMTAAKAQNSDIQTIEGLSDYGVSDLQKSFLKHGAAQCGICTPGLLITATALLRKNPKPSKNEVENALSGVLCRCTGYQKIINAVMHVNSEENENSFYEKAVGNRIPRIDGLKKVLGTEIFGADYWPKDSLLIKIIRSPYHRAKFEFGDLNKWKKQIHGLEIILTSKDIPGVNKFGVIPNFADQPALAISEAKFKGEAIAIVAGDYNSISQLDISSFPVHWKPAQESLTISSAKEKNIANIHSEREDNILTVGKVISGEPNLVLENSGFQVSGSLKTSYVEHAYIEPEAGASWMDGNTLVIQACTQAPIMDRDDTANILGLEKEKVRIIPATAGGGFGSKLDVSIQPLLGLVTLKTDKPCRIAYTRNESMMSTTKRHPSDMNALISANKNGKIVGMIFDGDFNTGAYASWGPTVATRVPIHASGPYYTPNYKALGNAFYSNGPISGAFRGFGVPQAAALQETLYDQLADICNIDQLEFRKINALQDGQKTVCGQQLHGVGILECLDALSQKWKEGLNKTKNFNKSSNVIKKGIGLGSCWYGCGNTALPNPSTIKIGIDNIGRLFLHQGATDIGQGSNTVITQICADALGVPINVFNLIGPDTQLTPDCGKTSASRQTYISGKAAELAGISLRKQILRLSNMGLDAVIEFKDKSVVVKHKDKKQVINLNEMDKNKDGYVLSAIETYDPPTIPLDDNGQGKPYAVYGYGVQMAEIEVNKELGTIKIEKITAVHDLGKVVNPLLAEGQIEGGVAQGLGLALMEEYIPDRTENLHDYLIPTIGDMPEIESIFIEKTDPEGPMGAKGLGEHVLIPTTPAILNALRNSTGAIIKKLPALPHRVLEAISEAENETRKN
ncbi:molybdopterin-dependent oxidoreductase [Alphaproteobacteria bacterium]|nr:molybdopterin-dependent oxidoreductase [Alphaproteobacteria bacterium]